jgi:hypothetical protein
MVIIINIGGDMAQPSKKAAQKEVEQLDLLVGMKAICDFMRLSEPTIMKYCREYDDFPVKKNGSYLSSRSGLNTWFRDFVKSR